MARKTKEESGKTRQGILDAAFDVFTSKGFMRTTLSDVAEAAGVTRGAIYWHFKDKVDLFMALSDEIEGEAGVRPEDIDQGRMQSLDDIREELLKYLAHFEKKDRYAVFYEMVNYRTEYIEELQPVLEKQLSNHRRILETATQVFHRFKETRTVRMDLDPSRAALSLLAIVVGITAIWLFDPGPFSNADTVPMILDDFLRSLRA